LLALLPVLAALYLAGRGLDKTFGEGSQLAWLKADPPDALRTGGVLHMGPNGEQPLCSVIHQRWAQCGKNRCWTWYAGMLTADGFLETDDGKQITLGSSFRFLPAEPGDTSWAHTVEEPRAGALSARARQSGISGFYQQDFTPGSDRIVERCLGHEDRVFAMGCVREEGGKSLLVPCSGEDRWTVVPGDGTAQPAIDEAANYVLYWFGGAFAAMFVACLVMFPRAQKLAEALERRARQRSRAYPWSFALLAVPVAVLATSLIQRGGLPQTSTWAYGRGGYALASLVAAGLALVAFSSARRRSILRHAIEPILRTPRSLLSQARDATVELSVRAASEPVTTSVVARDGVALSILQVEESYQVGKSTSTQSLHTSIEPAQIVVSDESGDGRLDLSNALVDGEVRTLRQKEPPDGLERRTGALSRHPSHVHYIVTEQILRPGEALYVFGEVTQIEMHGSEEGYRAVRGSPTLGGADAPLLVYAGTERGLVGELNGEHAGLGIVLSAALGSLAMLLVATAWLAAQ
jgi:hypothetical protein